MHSRSERAVAVVTAGASGIGAAISASLLAEGFLVHICDIDQGAIDQFVAQYEGVTATQTDVSDADSVARMFDYIEDTYDAIDVLVNNAGIAGPTAAVEDTKIADWDKTIAVDLNGQFYCTNRAVPLIKRRGGGAIVNISSNAALFGFPLRSPYTAAKWAMLGLTKTWAMELGPQNIRVNAICPGSVSGDRIEGVIERDAKERGLDADSIREVYKKQSSMRLFVSPQDIADMVCFLCSKKGASISGQSIAIDGHTESLSNTL